MYLKNIMADEYLGTCAMALNDRFTGYVSCEPMREVNMDGSGQLSTEHCEPEEAEFWGVYVQIKRDDRGGIWLEFQWVEDFYNEEDAKVFSKELESYIRANFKLASETVEV